LAIPVAHEPEPDRQPDSRAGSAPAPPATSSHRFVRLIARSRRALLAAGGGAVAALATPPIDIFPAMLVGLLLLALAIATTERVRHGFALGALWGTVGGFVGMRFVPSVIELFTDLGTIAATLAHVLLSAGQSLHWACGMALAVALRRRLQAPLELALGAGMLLALSLPAVFLWSPAALLSPWPVLVQSASIIGERGVSVLLALVAALLARALLERAERAHARRALAGAGAIVAAMLIHGWLTMRRIADSEGDERVTLGLVHAAVDPRFRWEPKNWPTILARLTQETARAEGEGVELSVWPEAAYPYPVSHEERQAPRGRGRILGSEVHGPILFGLITHGPRTALDDGGFRQDSYNSATLLTPDGRLSAPYDKMELLAFGESVPLAEHIGWLKQTFQRSGGLVPGSELRGLTLERAHPRPAARMGVFNCYEDTLPDFGRRIMNELAPNLLVNVTNDAWFVGTEEPELHLRLAVMRSIELRRDMVRAVNLGVPAWIDAAGRVRARLDSADPGWLRVEPSLRSDGPTVYARFGDLPLWLVLAAGAGLSLWRKRRQLSDAKPPARDAA
jgi:apolipoprotein N-acyltransferase